MVQALEIFRAMADPTRMRILALVDAMELSVGELAQVLCQSQPRVSRHVKILHDAGLIDRRREGAWVFMHAGDPAIVKPLLALIETCPDAASDIAGDLARLAAVRAERVAAAERYFSEHAVAWDALRSLHVADCEVEQAIQHILGQRSLGVFVDIGTGTGRMLELLSPMADTAIGLDRSSEMLRVARGKLESIGLGSVNLRQADMFALPFAEDSVDTILLHQVLHYTDAPADAIAEAARVLAPGGRLLVVDFAPHEREELRQRHAHARLGFADEHVLGWMRAAGLQAEVTDHLAGGELTVTLWLGTRPLASGQEKAA